jgi:coenzyme F420-0:L-glutamate ligase / coenzyme F420-1:gamma-L-glutamate ligase
MIEELIRSRRSIRKFRAEAPERALIEKLIAVACLAPSASNKQPWRFFVTDDRATIDRMAAAVQASVDRVAAHVDERLMDAFRAYGDYFVRFREAPVVVVPAFKEMVVLSNMVDDATPAGDRENIDVLEFNSGLISTSLALQNLMLYAHSLGLGSSSMTGPLLAAPALKEILGIPGAWRIAAVVPVGYPAESPAPTARKEAGDVIRWIGDRPA